MDQKSRLEQNFRQSAEETKIFAGKHPDIVAVVEVLGVGIVAVQPEPVVIAFDVEHLEVAIRVGSVRNALCCHCSSIRHYPNCKELYII